MCIFLSMLFILCFVPLLPWTHTYVWLLYLPHYWFHVICRCRQADTQHKGVRGGGQDTGDDGIPHGERQHGVNHKHNKQEEWHLWRKRHAYKTLQGKTVKREWEKGSESDGCTKKENTEENIISVLTVPWGNKEHVRSKSAHQNHHHHYHHTPLSKVYLCTAVPVASKKIKSINTMPSVGRYSL